MFAPRAFIPVVAFAFSADRVSAGPDGPVGAPIRLNMCSSSAPRQKWSFLNESLGGMTATNVVCKDQDNYILNCAGVSSDCHAWGQSFKDRNGVLLLNGTSQGFTVASWPDTQSLPVGPNQTPPGSCLYADQPGFPSTRVQMRPCHSPSSTPLTFHLSDGTLVDASSGLCLDQDAPPVPPFVGVTCETAPFSSAPYCNRSLPVADRVADLVSKMTTEEKLEWLESGNVGCPRLGLRKMQFGEGLHGVDSQCGQAVGEPDQFGPRTGCPTSYPSGIAEGATFNRSLWLKVGAADGREGRALHNQKDNTHMGGNLAGQGLAAIAFWAPDMNLFRDPRWGRGQEVPGEDPVLTSEYVKHFSQGLMHGDTPGDNDEGFLQIISTCKHFFGYDIETGRGGLNVNISARFIVEYYLPVFQACVRDAKVKSIMCSYNAVNGGVPSCANAKFQYDVVRGDWGWDGYIVSDCGAIGDIESPHQYTNNPLDTVAAALKAGTDLECDSVYQNYAAQALAAGKISITDVETAISRTLTHFI
eukprot:gene10624-1932_t